MSGTWDLDLSCSGPTKRDGEDECRNQPMKACEMQMGQKVAMEATMSIKPKEAKRPSPAAENMTAPADASSKESRPGPSNPALSPGRVPSLAPAALIGRSFSRALNRVEPGGGFVFQGLKAGCTHGASGPRGRTGGRLCAQWRSSAGSMARWSAFTAAPCSAIGPDVRRSRSALRTSTGSRAGRLRHRRPAPPAQRPRRTHGASRTTLTTSCLLVRHARSARFGGSFIPRKTTYGEYIATPSATHLPPHRAAPSLRPSIASATRSVRVEPGLRSDGRGDYARREAIIRGFFRLSC